jgi:gliding motility-associated-like protein
LQKKLHSILRQFVLFALVLMSFKAIAQPCSCVNCPKDIIDNDTIQMPIQVNGAVKNNLAMAGQGVCKVCITFKHDFVSDLQVELVSPSGQKVLLIAPISQTGFTLGAFWNICFVPCAQTAAPDPGFPDQWTNGNWANLGQYKGTYYPYSGCLENFNTGTVNGTWKLIVKDGDPNYTGQILNWSITFCDPTGLDCLTCIANAGDYSKIPAITACKGDNSLIFTPIPIYTTNSPAPPANLYSFTNVITKNGIVIGYQNPVNLSTYQSGVYDVCGLSYLTADAPKLPGANGTLTLVQLKNLMTGTKPTICGKFSKACIPVTIKPLPTPVFIDTVVCKKFQFDATTYTKSGFYTIKLKAKNSCDSTVYLNLTVIEPVQKDTFATVCQGLYFKVGTKLYGKTGIYKDTLLSKKTGCDSLVTLFLTIKSPPTNNLQKAICQGEKIAIGKKIYTITGLYKDTLQNALGCDSIVNLDLKVKPKSFAKDNITICNKATYKFGNKILTQTGVYQDTLKGGNKFGCDSIRTLNLTVLPAYKDSVFIDICQGDIWKVGTSTYTQTGNYFDLLKTKTTGCDSSVWTFLKVSSKITKNLVIDICKGSNFAFDGKILTQTGNYFAQNKSKNGCDSITNLTLTLHENPVVVELSKTICFNDTLFLGQNFKYFQTGKFQLNGKTKYGCDSITNINLTVLSENKKTIKKIICEDECEQIGSVKYCKSGIYTDTLKSIQYGCDSIVTLDLTIKPKSKTNIDTSLCFGFSIPIGTTIFDTTGAFTVKLKAKNGCDSIVNLTLKIRDKIQTNLTKAICTNSFYQIGKKKYALAGNYTDTLKNSVGCDSIIKLKLDVLSQIKVNLKEKICFGETYKLGVKIYDTTGIYKDTLKASGGCDSIVTLDLTVNTQSISNLLESICEGKCINIGKSTYCKSGIYKDILKNKNGCDSVVNLDLKIKKRPIKDLTLKICEGDTVKVGKLKKYYEAGIYNDTLVAQNGCDSILILDLFVTPKKYTPIKETLCFGKSIVINGKTYKQSGSFTDILKSQKTGCDSILNITINVLLENKKSENKVICKGSIYLGQTKSGTYEVETKSLLTGCDSIYVFTLDVKDSFVVQKNELLCLGKGYKLGDSTFTKSGIYRYVFKSKDDCDSIVYLNLKTATCEFDYQISKTDIGCGTQSKDGTVKITLKTGFKGVLKIQIMQFGNLLANDSISPFSPSFAFLNLKEGKIVLRVENLFGTVKYDTISILKVPTLKGIFSKVSDYQGFGVQCPQGKNGFLYTKIEGGKPPYKYFWNNNFNTENLEGVPAGKYQVTVTDTLGCFVVLDTTLIAPTVPNIYFTSKNLKCYESNDGQISIDSVTNGRKPFTYSIDLQGFSSNILYENLTAVPHLISVKDAFGCQIDTAKVLTQPAKIKVDLGRDTTISLGESVFIQASTNLAPLEIDKIKWNDFVVPVCPTCLQTLVTPTFSTGYLLYLTDKTGCTAFDVMTVFVRDTLPVFVPTAFSPNDDGINDYFTFFTNGKILNIKQLSIFNRWGSLLFKANDIVANDPSQGWDGRFKDTPQAQDVYVFYAEIELWDKTIKPIKGQIMLMR